MFSKLKELHSQSLVSIDQTGSLKELEELKIHLFGKKGVLTEVLKNLGELSPEERPLYGKAANETKQLLLSHIDTKKCLLEEQVLEHELQNESLDITLPSQRVSLGKKHPLNRLIEEIMCIFYRLGFSRKEGPDIETDYYNFEALNINADHPSRDMHDTFYFQPGLLLRTHTSPVQIRVMEREHPPLKIVVPGKVYRCDADVSHSPVFHQVEGLYVDRKVTFSELKGTLDFFLKELFGPAQKTRYRPSYFPFTEPSAEVDVECIQCQGKGCSVCKHTGWLEILGSGMVNRKVFRGVGYDPDTVTGFAFGLGVERIAMLKYRIPDIRLFYENDIRFLRQF